MPEPRPPQPATPARDAFEVHRERVAPDLELAFLREGVGGYPLLLVHGYPETKRIWWRNVRPLAEAGFEVIVPDLRGYGDSDLSPADEYDFALYSMDLHTLVRDVLGHERCGVLGGDVGGVVVCDLANRYPGFVDRMIFFNSIAPIIASEASWYAQRGLPLNPLQPGPTGDYRIRQGRDWEELIAELDTPAKRRRYVREFYEHRLLASEGSFDEEGFDFMIEPFEEASRLLASWAPYQLEYGRPMSDAPRIAEPVQVPTCVLYGPEDRVVPRDFPTRCEIAFADCVGPLVVPQCGHFLQWERADVLNQMARFFFGGLGVT